MFNGTSCISMSTNKASRHSYYRGAILEFRGFPTGFKNDRKLCVSRVQSWGGPACELVGAVRMNKQMSIDTYYMYSVCISLQIIVPRNSEIVIHRYMTVEFRYNSYIISLQT